MQRHAALLARIERQFGVPATLLMAIWTLESDNGTGDMGKLPVIRALATLAHDCRRTDLFQGELLAALQIFQRGDLSLRELIGAYAGENLLRFNQSDTIAQDRYAAALGGLEALSDMNYYKER
jgi:membrane-bound lytic murein transglycosylase B